MGVDGVGAVAAVDQVVAGPAGDGVVAGVAVQLVITRSSGDEVVTPAAADDVVARARIDHVVAGCTEDHVVAVGRPVAGVQVDVDLDTVTEQESGDEDVGEEVVIAGHEVRGARIEGHHRTVTRDRRSEAEAVGLVAGVVHVHPGGDTGSTVVHEDVEQRVGVTRDEVGRPRGECHDVSVGGDRR